MAELNVRVFVVEVPGTCAQCGNLPYHTYDTVKACCMYDAESPVHGEPNWVSVHTTESHTEAVKVAKDYKRARVRQFWLARTIPQRDTMTHKANVIIPDAPLNDWTCLDHEDQHARAIQPPPCPICHKAMMADANIEAMANPVDLEDIK